MSQNKKNHSYFFNQSATNLYMQHPTWCNTQIYN